MTTRACVSGLCGVIALCSTVCAVGAHAEAAKAVPSATCELQSTLKVASNGAWKPMPKGAAIDVVKRGPTWTDVVVRGLRGRVATEQLDSVCRVLEAARSPEPVPPAAPVSPTPPSTTATASASAPAAPAPVVVAAPVVIEPPPAAVLTAAPAEAAPQATRAAPRALRIAVKAIDVDDAALSRVLTDAVVAELRKLQRVGVIGIDEVQAMLDLEAQKQLAGCDESSCIDEIAAALGADILVVGSVARVDEEVVFELKRLEQTQGRADGSVTQRLRAAGGEESLAMVGPAIETLFDDFPLRDGLVRGVAPELGLRLNPPPVPMWGFGVVAATAIVATATAAVAGGINIAAWADGQKLAAEAEQGVVEASVLQAKNEAVETSFTVTVATGSVAGAAVVATGLVALFTDFHGYGE
jgi:hypothetical protein